MQPSPNAAYDCVHTIGDLSRKASTLDGQVRHLDATCDSLKRTWGAAETLQLLSRDALDDTGTP